MRLIGAGWGRTGSTSAAEAIESLGAGDCMKMQEMWAHPDLAGVWLRHLDGERVDWPAVLAGWGATLEWPGCWLWREFAELWPEAPVLLTVRDPADWYESVRATIHPATAPGRDLGPPAVAELVRRLWDRDFGGWEQVLDRDATIARYVAHNRSVREQCPPGRLVEWTVTDGWGPLCAALGVPVPDRPFPHVNRRSEYALSRSEQD
jgi:hypothetical protein